MYALHALVVGYTTDIIETCPWSRITEDQETWCWQT